MRIAIDAMGGDHAPGMNVEALYWQHGNGRMWN
jgi:fatty acid/phospholipid biosynthesis enzyme